MMMTRMTRLCRTLPILKWMEARHRLDDTQQLSFYKQHWLRVWVGLGVKAWRSVKGFATFPIPGFCPQPGDALGV
jgi:hypothetical protein